jgi:hypothetical protein
MSGLGDWAVYIDGKPWREHADVEDIKKHMDMLQYVKPIDPLRHNWIDWKAKGDEDAAAAEVASLMGYDVTVEYLHLTPGDLY